MKSTGLKDKNRREIMFGDDVRFKSWGNYWTKKVEKWEKGIYPFMPDISEQVGFYTDPKDCVVVS
jgi:hypothetical protein